MQVAVENLENLILETIKHFDKLTIISGFFSIDVLEDIAKSRKNIVFYYGMYPWNRLTSLQYDAFRRIESTYSNVKINIVVDYHVHTKCYLFQSAASSAALVGSANCSSAGLLSNKNCEMLINITDSAYIDELTAYAIAIETASVHFDNPIIIPNNSVTKTKKRISTPKERLYSGNPFVDHIPLYKYKNGRKHVPAKSGINWGLQKGNISKSPFAEAYIPIKTFDLKHYAAMFPPCGSIGAGIGGKKSRRLSPVTVTWDDGTVMQMLFQGVQKYPKSNTNTGGPSMIYPKQLTADEGGSILGKYLRERMNIPGRKQVSMKDFKQYGRDYITLTYIGPGNYEADFRPL